MSAVIVPSPAIAPQNWADLSSKHFGFLNDPAKRLLESLVLDPKDYESGGVKCGELSPGQNFLSDVVIRDWQAGLVGSKHRFDIDVSIAARYLLLKTMEYVSTSQVSNHSTQPGYVMEKTHDPVSDAAKLAQAWENLARMIAPDEGAINHCSRYRAAVEDVIKHPHFEAAILDPERFDSLPLGLQAIVHQMQQAQKAFGLEGLRGPPVFAKA